MYIAEKISSAYLMDNNDGDRNTHLSADFSDAGAGFGLLQRKRNLFLGITGLFYGDVPPGETEERPDTSV